MLLTQSDWRDTSLSHQLLVHPLTPWRVIGLTRESACFVVETSDALKRDAAIQTLLVSNLEELRSLVASDAICTRVYLFRIAADASDRSALIPLNSIRSYASLGTDWFICEDDSGACHNYGAWQPPIPDAHKVTAIWEAQSPAARDASLSTQ